MKKRIPWYHFVLWPSIAIAVFLTLAPYLGNLYRTVFPYEPPVSIMFEMEGLGYQEMTEEELKSWNLTQASAEDCGELLCDFAKDAGSQDYLVEKYGIHHAYRYKKACAQELVVLQTKDGTLRLCRFLGYSFYEAGVWKPSPPTGEILTNTLCGGRPREIERIEIYKPTRHLWARGTKLENVKTISDRVEIAKICRQISLLHVYQEDRDKWMESEAERSEMRMVLRSGFVYTIELTEGVPYLYDFRLDEQAQALFNEVLRTDT